MDDKKQVFWSYLGSLERVTEFPKFKSRAEPNGELGGKPRAEWPVRTSLTWRVVAALSAPNLVSLPWDSVGPEIVRVNLPH